MASPPAQPTVADAVRLMDALRMPSGTALRTTHKITPAATGCLNHSTAATSAASGPGGTTRRSTKPTESGRVPNLPAEIIFQIGTHLAPSRIHTTSSLPCAHTDALPCTATAGVGLSALLGLASASRSFHNTLVPLIWHTLTIRTPQTLPRLSSLLAAYDTMSLRSRLGQEGGLRHPLGHIRSIVVALPDKYAELDQTYLLALLRAMDLPRTRQVEHLAWSAECAPSPALWPLLAKSLRSLEVDGRMFYQGHSGWASLEGLEVLRMTGYDSTLLPKGAVEVIRARADSMLQDLVSEVPKEQVLQRVPRRTAQHLYLDASPTDDPAPAPGPVSTGMSRLRHLSLSSSKTSLLHQASLISAGCFVGLTCLDLYAVTPEPPLSLAILSAAATLTHLRLVLDISGAFGHFDALWTTLTAHLPHLLVLEIDPMPQQNTAPSFGGFVESCPRLRRINGRSLDAFPPCFGDFDPSHPSGALPY
ncbi:hypothetical protein PaG_02034 [Moesziomyces aphidis]|uniref:F-box domain-containing protein n=1 Tax=Moesziomyces aphidis TaxID=84754 RepID=W3VQA2_MOEAP|nr:hypothetical protein PaG_02034 [Moesziomyces aphidis]